MKSSSVGGICYCEFRSETFACGQQAVMICYVMTCSARTLTGKIRKHNTEKYLFFEEINTWETGFR